MTWFDPHMYVAESNTMGFLEDIDDSDEDWAKIKEEHKRKAELNCPVSQVTPLIGT